MISDFVAFQWISLYFAFELLFRWCNFFATFLLHYSKIVSNAKFLQNISQSFISTCWPNITLDFKIPLHFLTEIGNPEYYCFSVLANAVFLRTFVKLLYYATNLYSRRREENRFSYRIGLLNFRIIAWIIGILAGWNKDKLPFFNLHVTSLIRKNLKKIWEISREKHANWVRIAKLFKIFAAITGNCPRYTIGNYERLPLMYSSSGGQSYCLLELKVSYHQIGTKNFILLFLALNKHSSYKFFS